MQRAEYGRWRSIPSGHTQPSVRPEHWSGSESKSWLGQDWDVQAGRQAWYRRVSGHVKAAGRDTNMSQTHTHYTRYSVLQFLFIVLCSASFFLSSFYAHRKVFPSCSKCSCECLNVLTADRNLTAVIWTPPLNADVEFVARSHVGSQRHALVVDVLWISYPNLTECARWDLKTKKQSD